MQDLTTGAAQLSDRIAELTGLTTLTQTKLLTSLGIILVLWLARWIVVRIIVARSPDPRVRYRWRKTVTYAAVTVGILLVGRVWFEGVHSLLTYLGLLSAGIAIALKDPITDIAGWLFIVWRRPFTVGDRVQIGVHAGDVIDQRVFQFSVLEIGNWVDADQSTGRIIHVPNGKVFTEPLANYTRGFDYIWNEIAVQVTFESNWREAKQLLREIADRHAEQLSTEAEQRILEASRRFMIFYTTLTPTVYTRIADSGVLLTIRYLTEPRRRRGTAQTISEDVLDAFAARDDIDFAYPTIRYFDNLAEGKPGARPRADR